VAQESYSYDYIIPAGAHSEGGYGSFWQTDLTICNNLPSYMEVNISLLEAGKDNTNADNKNYEINSNNCIGFEDIYYNEFFYNGAGALKLSTNTNSLNISSRTYNNQESGTYGQYIPGFHKRDLLKKDETGYLIFLHKNENFRTNIGFASLSENAIEIELKLYDKNGTELCDKIINLQSFGYTQLNDIFGQCGLNNISYGFGTVRSEKEGSFYFAYASVIDNKTNDPTFVPYTR